MTLFFQSLPGYGLPGYAPRARAESGGANSEPARLRIGPGPTAEHDTRRPARIF
jgi:hypothetical protein